MSALARRTPPANLLVLLGAIFLIASGEELWSRFAPRYLETLGAGVLVVAAYGVLKDLLDALYPFAGGTLAATLGARRSLLLFNALALLGYACFALARAWWALLLALPLVMAWQSFSLPATFSMVAGALPSGRRSSAIAMQSLVRRVPVAIGPAIGGAIIAALGISKGVRMALLIGIALGLFAIVLQAWLYRADARESISIRDALQGFAGMRPALLRLLLADSWVRFGQGIGEVFIVLYAVDVLGVSARTYGLLVGLAMLISIAAYLPCARLADAHGKEPWITATFGFFALFPLALALTGSSATLPIAFALMGLREIGEPARKALIIELARPGRTSVDVGTYYVARGLAVFPASALGGLLWRVSPHLTFSAAGAVATVGLALFYFTVQRSGGERPHSS